MLSFPKDAAGSASRSAVHGESDAGVAPLRTADFAYDLPPELIAQTPVEPRDHSRLEVVQRAGTAVAHRHFCDLGDYLRAGDVLVCNETRVFPARLHGKKADTGGRVELLLLRPLADGAWETLARPARRLRPGARLLLSQGVQAEVLAEGEAGKRVMRFSDVEKALALGTVPLPPYIHAPLADPERYQTVFARVRGSAAAPTAGLHFTKELVARLEAQGVGFAFIALHIGLDTFRPVEAEDPRAHHIHSEYAELGPEVAARLNLARAQGGRIIAVGTTAVRTLETAARASTRENVVKGPRPHPRSVPEGAGERQLLFSIGEGISEGEARAEIRDFAGWTDLFILPGFRFRAVDGLVTNFHLPRTTLLMLVAAFAGKDLLDRAYREAIAQRYRFYSFGDCQLIV